MNEMVDGMLSDRNLQTEGAPKWYVARKRSDLTDRWELTVSVMLVLGMRIMKGPVIFLVSRGDDLYC
jgi:hypothetical protein